MATAQSNKGSGAQKAVPAGGYTPAPKFDKSNPNSVHNKININTATKEHLAIIPQMTGTRAQSIIDQRDLGGPFHRMAEVREITGIGEALAKSIMQRCYAGSPDEPSIREKVIDNGGMTSEEMDAQGDEE